MILTKAIVTIPGVSVAAAAVGVAYTTVATVSTSVREITIQHSLDTQVKISLDNGTTDHTFITGTGSSVIAFGRNACHWSGVLKMMYTGVAPSTGVVNFSFIAAE